MKRKVALLVTLLGISSMAIHSLVFLERRVLAQACEIVCPANITVSNDPGECGADVEYPPATPGPESECGPIACNPESGSFFEVGTTTVNCEEIIVGEAPRGGATCSFTITVNDTEPPTIECPEDIFTEAPPGQTSAVVFYPEPEVGDNCPSEVGGGLTPTCNPPSGSAFPVGITTVNCTVTDDSMNSASCSFQVFVSGSEEECTLTCPTDVFAAATGAQCGVVLQYVTPESDCGPVVCSPPSGSLFTVGTTTVVCTVSGGGGGQFSPAGNGNGGGIATCSFTVTVLDNSPPSITCPGNITTSVARGQRTATVAFATPAATDNCGPARVVCAPPSGSTFPLGTTTVTCTATDLSGNTATCTFQVRVEEGLAPTISCPANITINPQSNQCSNTVSFATPTVTGGTGATNVVCSPPSGSTFPVGTTTVNCTATDSLGQSASCSFTVTVNSPPAFSVSPLLLSFGVADPPRRRRSTPPGGCDCEETFTIQNTGCGPLTLTLAAIMRMGRDVDNGRITDTDDSRFFQVFEGNSTTPLALGSTITIPVGATRTFRVVFNPEIPAFARKTTGLAASQVLPEDVESKVVFTQSGGAQQVVINLDARVTDEIRLINPNNTRRKKEITAVRAGDEITITFGIFDADLDVTSARYEFLNSSGQVIGGPFDIDLAGPIDESDIIVGQSFEVVQRFTGARSAPGITAVRVTVFDSSGASDSDTAQLQNASASALMLAAQNFRSAATLYLPARRLEAAATQEQVR